MRGDIQHEGDEIRRLSLCIAREGSPHIAIGQTAVFAPVLFFDDVQIGLAMPQHLLDHRLLSLPIFRGGEALQWLAEEFLARVADDIAVTVVDIQDAPVQSHLRHPGNSLLDERQQAFVGMRSDTSQACFHLRQHPLGLGLSQL